jgi:hypothetical protein
MLHKALLDQAPACSLSAPERARRIEDGDLVILYLDYNTMGYARVRSGQTTQNKFGLFKHQVEFLLDKFSGYEQVCETGCSIFDGYLVTCATFLNSHTLKMSTAGYEPCYSLLWGRRDHHCIYMYIMTDPSLTAHCPARSPMHSPGNYTLTPLNTVMRSCYGFSSTCKQHGKP